ncbi:RecQ family ATP-dependent DNA helicase [Desulfoscipio geothermicus]|uniref:ATP-dependent DNA helicase RecQ n=1 Tax=Desulfoscipio geothermicus DSM 3669 TaxID=1121426 RepID=A0A1I6CPP1_9FIRM|nr:ATP-dependent DNA helicase RecQ [Desulfoscipio geothermicus]SFQ95156.1 ATP-dependent DNA helicase RecQ [Desulfoscipio geothermicus DSM 3669]
MRTGPALDEALSRHFHFERFRPGQKEVIEAALAGDDVLAVMPTGSGKSLCYQLPALLLPGLTLVISPLVALMKDQVDNLHKKDFSQATTLNSQLNPEEYRLRMRGIRSGEYKLVYVAPERLRNRYFNELINELGVDLLVVDEAHCISQWGHDFRPDYLWIRDFYEQLPRRPRIMALTATATPAVQRDILKQLGIPGARKVAASSDRPNLYISAQRVDGEREKQAALREFLDGQRGSGIIYAVTRKESEAVAVWVRESLGIPTGCYHAGLAPNERAGVQEAFIREEIRVVVATNAFGMGIDKANIRFVVHYSLPASLEAYYQEIGRAGRDGLPARCQLLFSLKDKRLQEWIIDNDAVTRDDLALFWRACARHADGGRSAVPLVELERAGLGETKLRLVVSMLERLQAVRLSDRDEEYLYVEPGKRPAPGAVQAALQEVENRLAHRKNKLSAVVNWANTTRCRRAMLLEYFGEEPEGRAEPCCDNCLAAATGDLEFSKEPLVVLACVAELQRGVGRKKLADILRGAVSANMSAFGYDSLIYYRSLVGKSGKAILAVIDRLLADGYLALKGAEYPVVVLTAQGRKTLKKGEPLPVMINKNKVEVKKSADRLVKADAKISASAPDERELLSALKEFRSSLARQEQKPAYIFFHDSVLMEIARVRPRTLAELRDIKGLGEKKVSAYGKEILSIIESFPNNLL